MSITRVHPAPGWGANEKLTSAQANLLDLNGTYALDKRSGQTDTLASDVTVTGALVLNNTINHNAAAYFDDLVQFSDVVVFNPTAAPTFNCVTGFTAAVSMSGAVTITGGLTLLTAACTFSAAVTASNFTMSATNRVKLASRSLTRTAAAIFQPTSSNWTWADGVASYQTTNTSLAAGTIPLLIPDGVTISQIRLWILPAAGHSGGGPANLPAVALYLMSPSGASAPTLIASQGDTYGSSAAYETRHAITLSGLALTAGRAGARYALAMTSEYGSGAVAGMIVLGADVTYTAVAMDDGY